MLASSRPHRRLRRQVSSFLGWSFSILTFLLVTIPLLDILWVVLQRGLMALNLNVLTELPSGTGGGLANAIQGTLLLVLGTLVLAIPIGVGTGLFLSEYHLSRWANLVRFLADVLTGVPSVVLGYFGYVTMVIELGWQFSYLAGIIVLALMTIPYIARTTELALRQVPQAIREGGYALGLRESAVMLRLILPIARPAVLSGILLSVGIAVGETAPLIYTAGSSNFFWNGHLIHEPIGYLTYVIWTDINQPSQEAHALAFAAAFLVMMMVLVVNLLARFLLRSR